MSHDNLCKSLVESNPRPFVTWLLGQSVRNSQITILKTELSVEPIRADFVSFLDIGSQILHLEFQTQADAEMPLRMLDYYTRLYRQYRRPVKQIVLFLRATTSPQAQVNTFETENTIHRYQVIRLWEVEASDLLPFPTLWPLAILAKSENPERLLAEVAQRLESLERQDERLSLTTYTYLLGGLKFRKEMLKQLLREEIMRESVTYRELVETSEQRGRQEGVLQGMQRGRQEGRQEGEVLLTLRLLQHKFGPQSQEISQQIRNLSISQLENLAESLLDFQTAADLTNWLEQPHS
ncbi:Rpn family recombination-promoting nuclease/putative transposase [Thermosynechococcaceae cyanobacterium BACA0444]|uniref:Rpn family recombination-promoting nuclease/putative transposase n=1 Tax=Pseudocalidococcus azoricus BACA0444 TaxID=2918990 RepID=A0AAE4FVP3_9CYAN|nr:Rpn family recombination-promoting nuclease/putative transposase [Pseudocalidococcus azoricus]MDS3861790.1 Rpn family recombination-promoting nuclease/putative transposase [Pseudocalidococcus azoricus BACA0444]